MSFIKLILIASLKKKLTTKAEPDKKRINLRGRGRQEESVKIVA